MLLFCWRGGSLRKRECVQRQPNNHNPPPSKLEIHCSSSPFVIRSISTYELVFMPKTLCHLAQNRLVYFNLLATDASLRRPWEVVSPLRQSTADIWSVKPRDSQRLLRPLESRTLLRLLSTADLGTFPGTF